MNKIKRFKKINPDGKQRSLRGLIELINQEINTYHRIIDEQIPCKPKTLKRKRKVIKKLKKTFKQLLPKI